MEFSINLNLVVYSNRLRYLWCIQFIRYFKLKFIEGGIELNIKNKIKNNKSLLSFAFRSYSFLTSFTFRVSSKNKLEMGTVLLSKSKIKVSGINNKIIIKDLVRLVNCNILIAGNNNTIYLGEEVKLYGTHIKMFGDDNNFHMDRSTTTNGNVEFNVVDGCNIKIGEDCMFSRNIHLWTGDFHSIFNFSGERINKSKDIIIGNRVWIGTECNILKGAIVGDNNVIGACTVVSGQFEKENTILVGNPAKIVKEKVNWTRENAL